MPSRLHQLEERFAEIGDQLDDSPVTEALSVLHAIVQEVARQAPPPIQGSADAAGITLRDVADLYLTAPPMAGAAESTGLPVGTTAPDFTLPDANGEPVSLSDFRGRTVVLVFYPLDWSPGCSRQLELYQQELAEFDARDAALIGVSADSLYSHGAWAAVRGITFPLLADFHPKGDVAQRYGVWRESDGFSDRALYVIDRDGVIRHAHVSPRVEHLPDIYELFATLDRLTDQQPAA
ncbi:peroxiredoxin [Blastococcus sp. HT6-30]|uniref:peroxiredoxin n=1 Tax=Blastococcus sp. HT6-30 TaxID=3144843 RepID=UPI00321B3E3B